MPSEDLPKIRVLLVGSGAIGTMAAYALEKGGQVNVTAVVRSSFRIVNTHGWNLNSVDHGKVDGWKPHASKRTLLSPFTSMRRVQDCQDLANQQKRIQS